MLLITGSDYIHKFVPAYPDFPHGSRFCCCMAPADENSLLSLGNELWPGAALLGLRGKVLENGMPAALAPDIIRDFRHLSVFIGGANSDPLIPRGQAYELAAILESGGADVVISSHSGGRELGEDDVCAAKNWLARGSVRNKLAG